MPSSVPDGMRLELLRARILPDREHVVDEWMAMLHARDRDIQPHLAAERAVVEATFRHVDSDGTTWPYHFSLMGDDSPGLDTSHPVAKAHEERGWEELQPLYLLMPDRVRGDAVGEWMTFARSGGDN